MKSAEASSLIDKQRVDSYFNETSTSEYVEEGEKCETEDLIVKVKPPRPSLPPGILTSEEIEHIEYVKRMADEFIATAESQLPTQKSLSESEPTSSCDEIRSEESLVFEKEVME